ncbi:DUF4388 domain-containing protein [Myxococcota bacterium]|nr:DUF4388 domain-containing protein [Myxococcota bacterium]
MPLSDLLTWLQTTSRSGMLTVTRDGNEWTLTIEEGRVAGYSGPELRDNLGHIVVTSGLVSEDNLRVAYQHQRDLGGSLRKALLSRHLISESGLDDVLLEMATEAIYDLFLDLPGEFVYSEQAAQAVDLDLDDDDADTLPLSLSINHLLMEGVRRQDEWEHIRQRFPDDNIQALVIEEKVLTLPDLGVRERRILAALSEGQSVSDICFELRTPVPSVLRVMADLLDKGAVIIVRDDDLPTGKEAQGKVPELLAQAEIMSEAMQFDEAVALLDVAVRMEPADESIRQLLGEATARQLADLYQNMPPIRIPIISDKERLRSMPLKPDERYLLDRFGPSMDIGGLIMLSPMSERETLKTLKRLLHAGVIQLS